ncbi:hypothetical protein IWQ56_002600, partial [Coemansia nantahalensis]
SADEDLRTVLGRLLTSQEQLVADVSLLQQTVSAILAMLHHSPPPPQPPQAHTQQQQQQQQQGPPRPTSAVPRPLSAMAQPNSPGRTLGGMLPTLASIVSPLAQPADQASAGALEPPKVPYSYGRERARATSGSDAGTTSFDAAASGNSSASRPPAHRRTIYEYHPADTSSAAASYYTAGPQRSTVSWQTQTQAQAQLQAPDSHPPPQPQGLAASRLPPPAASAFSSHGRSQLHRPHQHRMPPPQQQHQQLIAKPTTPLSTGLAMAPMHHGDYNYAKNPHNAPPLRFPHPAHVQYSSPAAAAAGPPSSAVHAEQTPAASAMTESPSAGSAALQSHPHHHRQFASLPGGSGGVPRAYGGLASDTMHKVEKNRFQANIRAFVDQHFMSATNLRWDYQQSFKAPHNAEATQQMVEAFRAVNGNAYERVEHGLGVYFSSLKAKHRTTEDKAMLKQQRDRRRARRIKKAAGRRKVFDRAQYPFLPADIDAQLCFVPLAMSPEHTDDDGEVKVGALPWRLEMYANLFHHLDTLRPKRTPRHLHPSLCDSSAPAPDIPRFMIDQAYLAMGHTHPDPDPDDDDDDDDDDDNDDDDHTDHPGDLEGDVEMDSSSDGYHAPSA